MGAGPTTGGRDTTAGPAAAKNSADAPKNSDAVAKNSGDAARCSGDAAKNSGDTAENSNGAASGSGAPAQNSSAGLAPGLSLEHASMARWLEARLADVTRDGHKGTTLLQGSKLPQVPFGFVGVRGGSPRILILVAGLRAATGARARFRAAGALNIGSCGGCVP